VLRPACTSNSTFNEEAERHCKNGDLLEKGLTISGMGLVYNFATEPAPAPEPVPTPVVIVKPPYPAKAPYAQTEAVEAEQVVPPIDPG
jgi:hypothetical protein